ncbi:MAG TPA: terminase family protein [Allosphingosinicella sp.]|nr:terminase family protein [Allosphingosinicella sp.]
MKRDVVEALAALPEDQARLLLKGVSEADALVFDADWESWARAGQTPPASAGAGCASWRQWVMLAGRGFGKTRAGAEYVSAFARQAGKAGTVLQAGTVTSNCPLRIALVGATIDEARAVMVEGPSGLLAVARADERAHMRWQPSRRRLVFASGAEARLYSAANPESLRGFEHHLAWCDELAKWKRAEPTWNNLRLGLRLGDPSTGSGPRAIVTTTPRPVPLLKRLLADPATAVSGGPSWANPHVAEDFLEAEIATHGGTRFGRQELEGVLLDDLEGALWTRALIERSRGEMPAAGTLRRVVVGVDPPAGAEGTCGIVVCGLDAGGIGHVLADLSVTGLGPEGWARKVAAAAGAWAAHRIVAEANNGGKMVETVLRGAEAGASPGSGGALPVTLVHAAEGKAARAEPVMVAFENGRIRLAGRFPELEDELAGLIYGGDYRGPGSSPDRADAMVWALTELVVKPQRAEPRIRAL